MREGKATTRSHPLRNAAATPPVTSQPTIRPNPPLQLQTYQSPFNTKAPQKHFQCISPAPQPSIIATAPLPHRLLPQANHHQSCAIHLSSSKPDLHQRTSIIYPCTWKPGVAPRVQPRHHTSATATIILAHHSAGDFTLKHHRHRIGLEMATANYSMPLCWVVPIGANLEKSADKGANGSPDVGDACVVM